MHDIIPSEGGDKVNRRIRELRKALNMSQQDFADKIKISRSNLGNIETGAVSVTDRVIGDICDAFKVNEDWIRFGSEPMFMPVDRDAEISRFIGEALADEDDNFKVQLLHVLSKLTDDQWEVLADVAELLLEEQQSRQAPPE